MDDENGKRDPRKDIGATIHRVSHHLKRQGVMPKDENDLTHAQRHVLHFILLGSLHRDVYQKDIEEEFQIRRSTATGILQLMEKKNLIYRESVKKDARLKRIVPTKQAEKIREEILYHIDSMEKKLRQGIPEEDIEICLKTLQKMLQNLTENEKSYQKEGEATDE